MNLWFRKVSYDTEVDKDMTDLQYVLDRIDVKERVQSKKELAALFKANANTN